MISYNRSAYGWRLIFQIHGSAVYRSVLPSMISVAIYFLFEKFNVEVGSGAASGDVLHPYAVGVLVSTSTFLIVFKLNQSYGRYWEACSSTTQFMSKWVDATTHTGVYHMQCDHYTKMKPPVFYDYPELNSLFMTRDRERLNFDPIDDDDDDDDEDNDDDNNYEHNDDTGLRNRKLPSQIRENNDFGGGTSSTDADIPDVPPSPGFSTITESKQQFRRYNSAGPDNNNEMGVSGMTSTKKSRKQHQQFKKEENKRRSVAKSINYLNNNSNKHHHKSRKSRIGISLNGSGGNLSMRSGCSTRSASASIDCLYDVTSLAQNDDLDLEDSEASYYEENVFHSMGSEQIPLVCKPRLDGNWGEYYTKDPKHPLSTFVDPRRPDNMDPKGFASIQGGRTPPLFLQELAHLSSLMNAVALSTLRNDMEGCQSPLGIYEFGGPWPEVDPNNEEWLKKKGFKALSSAISRFVGVGLSEVERSKHNAALPLPVIGGVSDAEIRLLQIARGPWAKTQLCFNWLSEFIIREHLAGSLGNVGPPIISRIIQFLGDGMIYYNHARKIMFIPFPFVHAQLSVMFVIVMVAVIPFLMHQYTDEPVVGAILTFFTVLCLCGINEVARDLENPFRNFPNELPLVNFQAQYNEALLTMYAGYHPDLFWDGDDVLRKASRIPMTDIQEEEVQHENATQGEPVVSQRETPTPDAASPTDTTEIATLKKQLEEQAKLIETLFAKVGSVQDDEK
jgi:predicted membrane chloride channel (bestrophin family)